MILLAFSLVLLISTILPSIAYGKTYSEDYNESVEKLAQDLDYLFEEATTLVNDKYVLNEDKAAEYFGEEHVAELQLFIKLVNGEQFTLDEYLDAGLPIEEVKVDNGLIGINSWWGCLKEKIMIATGIGFISGGLKEMLEKKLWAEAAKEIVKIVGKNAVKGGVIGLTASLAVWSIACIGK
jgi:hypothetical protein